MNAQPIPDDPGPQRSLWTRLREGLLGADDLDDEEMEATTATSAQGVRTQALRLHNSRGGRVAVRLNAQEMEDARVAADGLKNGEHQIVNLERATAQAASRIFDFLSGVVYALDGVVERVGDRVYIFVPANVSVEVDRTGSATQSARPAYGEGQV